MKRFEIFWVKLDKKGSIQGGLRPCLVVSNDVACRYSPTIIVVPITSKNKKDLPTHMNIQLSSPSTVLFEQFLTVNKNQIGEKITNLPKQQEIEAEHKMLISLGISPIPA